MRILPLALVLASCVSNPDTVLYVDVRPVEFNLTAWSLDKPWAFRAHYTVTREGFLTSGDLEIKLNPNSVERFNIQTYVPNSDEQEEYTFTLISEEGILINTKVCR
tara:strand:- start:3637 stop:3954 length:318 start_codon:yes stop_codon:yes gene_type:complete